MSRKSMCLYHFDVWYYGIASSFGHLHVERSFNLYTRYRWPEAMCPSVCVKDDIIIPLKFQCRSEIGSG